MSESLKPDEQPAHLKTLIPDRIALEKALMGFFYASQVRMIQLYDL
jgi:hypothetical protein